MRIRILLSVVSLLWFCGAALGQDEEQKGSTPPALTPKEADGDFALQGEYEGTLKIGEGEIKLGVQVIALGDGKFEAIGYHGGLPGAGADQLTTARASGTVKDGAAVVENDHVRGIAKGDRFVLETKDGSAIGTLERAVRESPTLGLEPPEGTIVLFDGKSADNFEGGRMSDDGLLIQGATSRAKFQDCTVHLEFMLSYMPQARGQERSNSGCYLQGRYEVQILDSFGLKGEDNECGGIYGVKAPAVNMCFPPLAWQTYDIDFTAARYDDNGQKAADARMTVKHNGVLIHENVPIPAKTRAAPIDEGPEPGPLYLQDHHNPVRFRNIWVKDGGGV